MILQAKLRAMQRLVQMRERLVELAQAPARRQRPAACIGHGGRPHRPAQPPRARHPAAPGDGPGPALQAASQHRAVRWRGLLQALQRQPRPRRGRRLPQTSGQCLPAGLPSAQRLCGARYGGEEFALILPNTPTPGAWVVVDALRAALDAAACRTRLHRGLACDAVGRPAHHRARQPDHTHRGAGARRPGPLRSQTLGRNRIVMVGGYESLDGSLASGDRGLAATAGR